MTNSPLALPQENLSLDGRDYLMTAMTATDALIFQEKQLQKMIDAQEEGSKTEVDFTDIKKYVCKYVSFENKQITEKTFDIIFARKTAHLHRLFEAFVEYNFNDPLEESGSEE